MRMKLRIQEYKQASAHPLLCLPTPCITKHNMHAMCHHESACTCNRTTSLSVPRGKPPFSQPAAPPPSLLILIRRTDNAQARANHCLADEKLDGRHGVMLCACMMWWS